VSPAGLMVQGINDIVPTAMPELPVDGNPVMLAFVDPLRSAPR